MGASQPSSQRPETLTSIEICAGAGGQAVGLDRAGFRHLALVEYDRDAVETLRENVQTHRWEGWDGGRLAGLEPMDVKTFLDSPLLKGLDLGEGELDLFAGGVPCPPFSLAGKRLGRDDERDLFPYALDIIEALKPKAVMIENVRGILEPPHVFIEYRRGILESLAKLGYAVPQIDCELSPADQDRAMRSVWRRIDAYHFGVPQLRPRAVLVVIRRDLIDGPEDFPWPLRIHGEPVAAVDKLSHSMKERCRAFWTTEVRGKTGQKVYDTWREAAEKAKKSRTRGVAPTLVGGSRKHGGADLGPSRAKKAWEAMGVDANGVANDPEKCDPERDLFRPAGPMLTVSQAAILQGFPETWRFMGGKTAKYRQVGNAFPPPVAEAVGRAIHAVLRPESREEKLADYVIEGEGSAPEVPAEPEQIRVF
ncbi:DNA cytosine methyltransferase [Streptomyces sp. YIM 98790]|uniref:DNA cytosine methyltransferase n=1 Tax=Streptomyces sp. YIM 98790 TaxID=2689077 RepID=UPI00140D9FE1|nr:DNA (cytosine-5-)-methyltransferase [Streptomyces sp. YIM 98790]